MTEEETILLKAVLDDSDNDAPRLRYADWCEQQSDEAIRARAEFIRTQIKLVNQFSSMSYEQWFDAAHLVEKLRDTHRLDWAGTLVRLVEEYAFDKGFIAFVKMSGGGFLEHAPQLFDLAPIRHLKLTEVRSVADELFVSPHLSKIISIDMERCNLENRHLEMLAASPVLENLKWLSVAENNIGFDGIDALAASALSKQLVYVNFYGNPVDPGGQYSTDNEFIMDSWLPEAGKQLEAKHGYLPWLHRDADTTYEAVPDRFRLT